MEHLLPRDVLWVDKKKMGDFLTEPLNKKLYEIYLKIKRKKPSQDFRTLQLFNEVYYLCTRIIIENDAEADLEDYIQEIKKDMGWDYSTSLVVNMIYAVLSLRRGNSSEVRLFLLKIKRHYKLDYYKTSFSVFVEEEIRQHQSYDLDFLPVLPTLPTEMIDINSLLNMLKKKGSPLNLTINITNDFKGSNIEELKVKKADVVAGVAEKGSNVFHHNK